MYKTLATETETQMEDSERVDPLACQRVCIGTNSMNSTNYQLCTLSGGRVLNEASALLLLLGNQSNYETTRRRKTAGKSNLSEFSTAG